MTQICGINSSVPPTLRSICCVRLVLYCLRRLARVFSIWTLLGFLSFPSRQPSCLSCWPDALVLGGPVPLRPNVFVCFNVFSCLWLHLSISHAFTCCSPGKHIKLIALFSSCETFGWSWTILYQFGGSCRMPIIVRTLGKPVYSTVTCIYILILCITAQLLTMYG